MQSGFDIDLGNACSKDAFGWAKKTFANRNNKAGATALDVDGAFSNLLIFGKERIGITSDGIGTKIELAERTGIYHTLGYDLVAMVVDDLATAGFEPTTISNIIDVDKLDRSVINEMMRGLHDAANFAKISISGGEIAELGNRINGYGDKMHFNWCSTAVGVLPKELEKPIDGTAVKAGQIVLALKSPSFRSNGFSVIRRVMQANFGDQWHNAKYNDSQTWGEALLEPCLIYAPFITELITNNIQIAGLAHITGGGVFDNFERVLKANKLGCVLDNLVEPLEIMQKIQQLGNIPDEKAYLYWNMANGMLMVADETQVDSILQMAKKCNYHIQVAGRIIAEPTMSLTTISKNVISRPCEF